METESVVPAVNAEDVIADLKAKEKWSEEDGRAALQLFEASGLKPTEFCRKHGFKPYRLGWWLRGKPSREKNARQRKSVPVTFAPVRLIDGGRRPGGAAEAPGAIGESMEVVLGNGRRVVVGAKFEAPALVRLVKALEEVSC